MAPHPVRVTSNACGHVPAGRRRRGSARQEEAGYARAKRSRLQEARSTAGLRVGSSSGTARCVGRWARARPKSLVRPEEFFECSSASRRVRRVGRSGRPVGWTAMPSRPVYEPVGGGWYKVIDAAKSPCWWHGQTGQKVWTEPTAQQMRTGGVIRKSKATTPRALAVPRTGGLHGKHRTSDTTPSLRPVVPLELPTLSPRSSPKRESDVVPDTALKPRLKVAPIPRRGTRSKSLLDVDIAVHMRQCRLESQRAQELETYLTAFHIIDLDGSGKVDPPEVLKALKMMGKKVDDHRFWEVFRDLDLDNSSSLEYNEFEIVMDSLARKKGPNVAISQTSPPQDGCVTPRTMPEMSSPKSPDSRPGTHHAGEEAMHTTPRRRPPMPGQIFMNETLESLRQLVDINAAAIRNREEAERIGLADRETDSRTRSKLGREALLEEQRGMHDTNPSNFDDLLNNRTTREVMDRFALLFT